MCDYHCCRNASSPFLAFFHAVPMLSNTNEPSSAPVGLELIAVVVVLSEESMCHKSRSYVLRTCYYYTVNGWMGWSGKRETGGALTPNLSQFITIIIMTIYQPPTIHSTVVEDSLCARLLNYSRNEVD